jgi:hypothetical protein
MIIDDAWTSPTVRLQVHLQREGVRRVRRREKEEKNRVIL